MTYGAISLRSTIPVRRFNIELKVSDSPFYACKWRTVAIKSNGLLNPLLNKSWTGYQHGLGHNSVHLVATLRQPFLLLLFKSPYYPTRSIIFPLALLCSIVFCLWFGFD